MGKSTDTEIEQIKEILSQVNQKLLNAKVLNGGFDRLQEEISEIKQLQSKFNTDFEAHKLNDDRIESKLDRLYDPEVGIYSKVHKTETMIENLTTKVDNLSLTDEKIQARISATEIKANNTLEKVESIQKITGEDNKELQRSIRLSKGFWWFIGFAGVGLLSALGEFLWRLFVG
jgi:chromosome segregation ATPase